MPLPRLRSCRKCGNTTAEQLLQDVTYVSQNSQGAEITVTWKICPSCVDQINQEIDAANQVQ